MAKGAGKLNKTGRRACGIERVDDGARIRRGEQRLEFGVEQIAAYLTRGPGVHDPHGGAAHDGGHAAPAAKHDLDEEFFLEALLGHERMGWALSTANPAAP